MRFIDKVAWVHTEGGRVLSTRSRGKSVYTLRKLGVFEAQAHGNPAGVAIKMACYDAQYSGELKASAEVEEFVWLTYADRDRVAPVDQIIFDWLRERGDLA